MEWILGFICLYVPLWLVGRLFGSGKKNKRG